MFKLNVINNQNVKDTIYFDNHTFKFFKDNNGNIPLQHKYEIFTNDKVDPKNIVLVLGYNCSNKCIYCTQRRFKDEPCDVEKLKDFIEELAERYPTIEKIHFIGGEPLLEWNTITEIVNYFDDKYKYSIVTNGLNIDLTVADFLIKHQFEITLSHDGESQLLQRGKDILVKYYPNFKVIQWLSNHTTLHIESVLCGDTTSTKERWEYFTRLPLNINSVDVKPVTPYKKEHIPLVPGQHDWNLYFAQLLQDIYEINSLNDWDKGDTKLILDMVSMLANTATKYNPANSRCPIFNKHIFTINQSGYMQYCHNCKDRITRSTTLKYMRKDRVDECNTCPLVLTCTSACRIIDDDCFKVVCPRNFYHNLAYFIYFVHQTFGYVITSIEGDFKYAVDGKFEIAVNSI